MDWLELQRRARGQRPELAVIFISAYGDEEIRRRALDGGALRFFHKPFDGKYLLDAIDRISGVDLGDCADQARTGGQY
jgi:FixJ family two-component response regulator